MAREEWKEFHQSAKEGYSIRDKPMRSIKISRIVERWFFIGFSLILQRSKLHLVREGQGPPGVQAEWKNYSEALMRFLAISKTTAPMTRIEPRT